MSGKVAKLASALTCSVCPHMQRVPSHAACAPRPLSAACEYEDATYDWVWSRLVWSG